MELSKLYKSSNQLTYNGKLSKKFINSISIVSNDKSLQGFISSKNKLIFKSCFDKKGTKQFLSEKEKAMAEITLFDELLDEDNKIKKKHHSKKKSKKNGNIRSKSEKTIKTVKDGKHKNSSKKTKISSNKNLKKKTGFAISINYIEDEKKEKEKNAENYKKEINDENTISNNNALKVNKKRVNKIASISSNFSAINLNETMNLATNKNDSFINSIVNEMDKVKN